MATQSFEQLIAGANKIKTNELPESNTASLVGEQLIQMVNKQSEEHSERTAAISKEQTDRSAAIKAEQDARIKGTTEYNVSVQHPTGGISGTNKYTLETAIQKIPAELRTVGIKCSFLDERGYLEQWVWNGNTYSSVGFWSQITNTDTSIFNANLYLGRINSRVTLEEAISAAKKNRLNNIARVISFWDGKGKIAIFKSAAYNTGWDDVNNWDVYCLDDINKQYKENKDKLIEHDVRIDNAYLQSKTLQQLVGKVIETSLIEKKTNSDIPLDIKHGYYEYNTGVFKNEADKDCAEVSVKEGEVYLLTTVLRSAVIAAIVFCKNDEYHSFDKKGSGSTEYLIDYRFMIPAGVTSIKITNASKYNGDLSLKKESISLENKSYTKSEADNIFEKKSISSAKYGVKWSVSDSNDLGQRCFDAVGKNAKIAIGSTAGNSDFDNIYPWSGIKRCNIKVNSNGGKTITFEGEAGFALDGSNGDVFVRVPKFAVDKYIEVGYEYRVISQEGKPHPLFIENGKELDEVFIGAFEASKTGDKLYSKADIIPANNLTPVEFLNAAKTKGIGYSLYDMRCVDAIWTLMAVEFGCRNTNRIIGYGYSGYIQAATYQEWSHCTLSQTSTNSITLGKPSDNTERLAVLDALAKGQNICICGNKNDGSQTNILAQRRITNITCNSVNDNFIVTFDGEPIDVDAKTADSQNYTYVGNAPITCNYCESVIDEGAAMTYHTGRTNRKFTPLGGELHDTTANTCRYRWIENVVGNVWHFLPDVTFNAGQMYICQNIDGYEFGEITPSYYPIGDVLPIQESNGHKADINTSVNPNFWIKDLFNDYFYQGFSFGQSFDETHDGNITSQKAFGAYYYLNKGSKVIIANGGGFDHLWRCNMLTHRAWLSVASKWYLYGARLIFKKV